MSFRCVIPDNPFYKPLIANAQSVCDSHGITLHVMSEQECIEAFIGKEADLALLTPSGYGQAADAVDCAIVPQSVLSLSGYTQTATLYIRPGEDNSMETCASSSLSDFIIQAGLSALSEKFDVSMECRQVQKPIAELLQDYDVVIEWGYDPQHIITLDVSDEWTDSHKQLLPASLWVCSPDAMPDDIEDIIISMAQSDNPDEYHILEEEEHGTNAERDGKIMYAWSEDFEQALEHALEILFYMQVTPSIAPVRILGREDIANTISTAEIMIPVQESEHSMESSTEPSQTSPQSSAQKSPFNVLETTSMESSETPMKSTNPDEKNAEAEEKKTEEPPLTVNDILDQEFELYNQEFADNGLDDDEFLDDAFEEDSEKE